MEFSKTALYGGAMSVEVPKNYYDVSDLRQVPDTQEVFQEREGIHNVIFDILEYVENIEDPLEAARYHLEDYVDGDGDLKIWNIEAVKVKSLPDDASCVNLLATTPPHETKSTAIFLLLVRLKKHATDILITVNLHNISTGDAAEYDALFQDTLNKDLQQGKDVVQRIIDSFEIKNYKLFYP